MIFKAVVDELIELTMENVPVTEGDEITTPSPTRPLQRFLNSGKDPLVEASVPFSPSKTSAVSFTEIIQADKCSRERWLAPAQDAIDPTLRATHLERGQASLLHLSSLSWFL